MSSSQTAKNQQVLFLPSLIPTVVMRCARRRFWVLKLAVMFRFTGTNIEVRYLSSPCRGWDWHSKGGIRHFPKKFKHLCFFDSRWVGPKHAHSAINMDQPWKYHQKWTDKYGIPNMNMKKNRNQARILATLKFSIKVKSDELRILWGCYIWVNYMDDLQIDQQFCGDKLPRFYGIMRDDGIYIYNIYI